MKTLFILLASAAAMLRGETLKAQNSNSSTPAEHSGTAVTPATTEPSKATRQELEDKFKATLTEATLAGRWCSLKDGVLGTEKEDKYTIVGVTKLNEDAWIIKARIQYNKVDLVAPIPVEIKWAGDAPVIVVNNIPIPGGGTYSARVLIYGRTYSGSWSGGEHGGLLYGVITTAAAAKTGEGK